MTQRLLVLAHGRAGSAADPVFGDQGPLLPGAEVAPVGGRVSRWVVGPEIACAQTVELVGGSSVIETGLRGPDLGDWTGRSLSEIAAEDAVGLRAWASDPEAAPHGGESLAVALDRIGRTCDGAGWPDGRSVVVVTPAVARMLAVHAIGGDPAQCFRLDVRFGGRFELSRAGHGWRLLLG